MGLIERLFAGLLLAAAAWAQTTVPARFVGTITQIKVDTAEVVVKPDNAAPVTAKLTSDSDLQRVDPGAKDLKSAQSMKVSDIAIGDRVTVNMMPDLVVVRRMLVMPASDITKRNEADRADWTKRGISGVVAAKNGNDVVLKMRSMQGETRATVTVGEKTVYRRYAPDSVKFADAKVSKLDEVSVGDQLRARGQKADDGSKVTAEEVVFGTFLTKAGSVTAVNVEAREITLKEMGTNAPLVIKLTADSQLKQMPNFGGMMPGGAQPGGAQPGGAQPGGAASHQPGQPGAGGAMMVRPGGGAPDLAQMIERMPPGKLDAVKPGETIVVSSTKGAKPGELTAITLLSNADTLIRMLTMISSMGGGRAAGAAAAGPSLSGLATGLDGLGLGINP